MPILCCKKLVYKAFLPVSPVLTLITSEISEIKIFPSPICPVSVVFAEFRIASTTFFWFDLSVTAVINTFGTDTRLAVELPLPVKTSTPSWNKGVIHPLQLAIDVMETMDNGDHLVFDGGNTHFWSEIAANLVAQNGKILSKIMHPGSFSLLGLGVSFAISLKRINPNDTVVLISGDGAFLSGGLSIEVAFQENLPIIVIIDNNGGLDCISQQQERMFDSGSHFATDFRDIPFHSMFEGLGGHGELVESQEQLQPALKRALESGKTACLNVRTQDAISPIVLATTNKRDKASIE